MENILFNLGLLCLLFSLLMFFNFKRKKGNLKHVLFPLFSGLVLVVLVSASSGNNIIDKNASPYENDKAVIYYEPDISNEDSYLVASIDNKNLINKKEEIKLPFEEELKIHFIDVGQADSILIQLPNNHGLLIDAGNNNDAELLTEYIDELEIETFDLVIGTHPHEDHIGSLDTVINNYDVKKIIMPKVSSTTKTFEDVLTAISDKNLKITSPIPGETYVFENAKLTILGPNEKKYNDLNNYSVVAKLEYGDTSFMLTGDAEDISEKEILEQDFDLKSDLLKVGHHGSDSSTTPEFLKAVDPKYAIISCGEDNKYGHPNQEVLELLNLSKVDVFRTDEVGTIVATSDGEKLSIDKNKSTIKINAPPVAEKSNDSEKINDSNNTEVTNSVLPSDAKYIGNKSTHKLHLLSCYTVDKIKDENKEYFKDYESAIAKDYEPCKLCKPSYIEKVTEPIKETNTKTYVGSKNSNKFHTLDCTYAKKIAEDNRIYFSTIDEALDAGYVPCKRCNP